MNFIYFVHANILFITYVSIIVRSLCDDFMTKINLFWQAYVVFVQNMGGVWLERNMTTFLSHVLDLVANPKAASSHVDAVYSR